MLRSGLDDSIINVAELWKYQEISAVSGISILFSQDAFTLAAFVETNNLYARSYPAPVP